MHHLENKRFGRLVAVDRSEQRDAKGHRTLWRCRCDCGEELLVKTDRLINGNIRSCGCMQTENRKADIAGQRFGRLMAVRPTGETHNHSALWECTCDCGEACIATVEALRWGAKASCGCLQRETKQGQARAMQGKQTLVEGTRLEQLQYRGEASNNTSGRRGVGWHRCVGKWAARIQLCGHKYPLGYYTELADAIKAREAAERLMYDEFIRRYEAGEFVGKKMRPR